MRVTPRLATIKLGDCPLFEIARVLVRLAHVARRIVNPDHGIMCTAVELRVADCVRDFGVHRRPNGSASEMRSKPRLSLRGAYFVNVF